ncbi:ubiquitin carboxyl-terminal hydrolase 17-like protein 13, partial [Nannospalax galili]
NVGNSCYVNAALQCLTYTPPLAHCMLSGEHSRSCVRQGGCIMCAMEAHVACSLCLPGEAIRPSRSLTAAFHRSRQEDAHEFLMFTLNAMHESCLRGREDSGPGSEDSTPIREIFGGHWRSRIRCLHCRGTSDTFDPYLDIALEIQAARSVNQALEGLVKPEELRGETAYHCGSCQKNVPASRTLTFHTASKVLMLVLKRFSGVGGDKDDREVQYPEELDLRPYVSGTHRGPLVYILYAVLVHSGRSCHGGHYFCYTKAGSGQWYKMDDATVTRCDPASVLDPRAYVLFYVQQSRLRADGVPGPVGVSSGAEPEREAGPGDLGRELGAEPCPGAEGPRGPWEEEAEEEEALSLDRWKALREQNRPKCALQPRKVDHHLPAHVVVLHGSRSGGEGLGRSHPDKENDLWTGSAALGPGPASASSGRLP